jgi:uncharacterized protein YqhQ
MGIKIFFIIRSIKSNKKKLLCYNIFNYNIITKKGKVLKSIIASMLSLLILIMAIYILSESKDVKQQEIKIEVEVPELKK